MICTRIKQKKGKSAYGFDEKAKRKGKEHEILHFLKDNYKVCRKLTNTHDKNR